jgi:rfaE bifunctional protein kinase chain/domain
MWLSCAMRHTPSQAAMQRAVAGLAGHSVAVVGDPVLDVYLLGTTHRISREAPVLIVREDGREFRLGGAANTAANFAALGAQVRLVGLVGADEEGRILAEEAARHGIDAGFLAERKSGCTVTKTRVLAGGLHTTKQQMLRIDRENPGHIPAEDEAALMDRATQALEGVSALVISDYGEAQATELYVTLAKRARDRGVRVVVDSRHALLRFAGVTAVTPNEPEVEAALGVTLRSEEAALAAAARLVAELGLEVAVVTRGREGMAIATRAGRRALLAAHGGHEAVDVTGAGDTVTATFTLALLGGADEVDAAALANCAASIVVKEIGAATCTPEALAALAQEELT